MNSRPALSPHRAAEMLAQWWELAGLEAVDLSPALASLKAARRAPPPTDRAATQAHVGNAAVGTRAPPSAPPGQVRAKANVIKPVDALAQAHALAAACTSLSALRKALEGFEGCGLKANARNCVFGHGADPAQVMIVGEAPGLEDDETGLPFQGESGQLLTKMLASIGLSATTNCYLAPLIPWRPPGDRPPTAEELAVCLPFFKRHIALVAPKAILCLGGLPAQALLDTKDGIMKQRLKTFSYGDGIYAQAVLSPAYLMKRPAEKALAWQDLLSFQAKIASLDIA